MQTTDFNKKMLVIGSGPIVIGQAAEFDYSGTQACQSLKEEGYQVVLANSNPATIMTDETIADVVYMEPLTVSYLEKIIEKEQPDAILPSFGGQTALNLAVELDEAGILNDYGVKLLGTSLTAIQNAEDREKFRDVMYQIHEPVPENTIVKTLEQALDFAEDIGYPVMVRPAYTLGGTGGGICENEEVLIRTVQSGLSLSAVGQCLLEKSIAGYKEIEFEVIRDAKDQQIIICGMENIDPVGIHTGDSIVVAPIQTLTDRDLKMLRSAAMRIVSTLEIEGACNVQLALHPTNHQYYVIEVNPRVSRSSALASKATGYPIAKISAKISIGLTLDQIVDPNTNIAYAFTEPELDYIVTKFPRFAYDKFTDADRTLQTQMKATGEIMAIGKTLSESLLKGLRSMEYTADDLYLKGIENVPLDALKQKMKKADDERIYVIAEAFRQGMNSDEVYELTKIEHHFLLCIAELIQLEKQLTENPLSMMHLQLAKEAGFSDETIARCWHEDASRIYELRKEMKIMPAFETVHTFEAEHATKAPYYYSTFQKGERETDAAQKEKIIVIGSGPIRIGQGVEFDYATVHSIAAIQEMGYEAIIINNNPETVSTDFSISDKLYFEPLTLEDVLHVIDQEKPLGVVVQFGGQTAINLAAGLEKNGINILGTDLSAIERAENRGEFEALLNKLQLQHPACKAVTSEKAVFEAAEELGYPVVVRPSYVIGGSRMALIHNNEQLAAYMKKNDSAQNVHPILVDKYITGIEVEVDAISDGQTTVIPGIMEHLERPGIHSGDSIAVYPPQRISELSKQKIADATMKIAAELPVVGLINIQFIVKNDDVFVLEVNPRSSRTVPFLSKLTGVNMAKLATNCLAGQKLREAGFISGVLPEMKQVAVKVPVFSFIKLRKVNVTLGPEMKSTGEVIGMDETVDEALAKGFLAAGYPQSPGEKAVLAVSKQDAKAAVQIAKNLQANGVHILTTGEMTNHYQENDIPTETVMLEEVHELLKTGKIGLVVYNEDAANQAADTFFKIGCKAAELGIQCLTNTETAEAYSRLTGHSSECIFPVYDKKVVHQ